MRNNATFAFTISVLIILATQASALTLSLVETGQLIPGSEGDIRLEVENNLDDDVEDVALSLKFANLPFIPIGTSEKVKEEIESDDEEDFTFRIKASNDIIPGDYELPYTLTYKIKNEDELISKSGSIGIKVSSNPELSFTLNTQNPVINTQGQLSLKIVNKGFYDARFVSVKLLPSGFTTLSEEDIYIGSVDSDDFETANFDVIYLKEGKLNFEAIVEYTDFSNKKVTQNINLPITVYSQEKAIELGLAKPNRTTTYIGLAVILIVVIIAWRAMRRRMRLKKSMAMRSENGAKK